jgi:hypothetical protein
LDFSTFLRFSASSRISGLPPIWRDFSFCLDISDLSLVNAASRLTAHDIQAGFEMSSIMEIQDWRITKLPKASSTVSAKHRQIKTFSR